MATAEGLMGVGVPAEVALRTGWTIVTVTTNGSTQGSTGGLLKGPGNKIVLADVAGSNGAVTLPADAGLGDELEIYNTSGTAGRVYPPSGGTLQNGTANQFVTLAANGATHIRKVSATNWRVTSHVAVTPA